MQGAESRGLGRDELLFVCKTDERVASAGGEFRLHPWVSRRFKVMCNFNRVLIGVAGSWVRLRERPCLVWLGIIAQAAHHAGPK